MPKAKKPDPKVDPELDQSSGFSLLMRKHGRDISLYYYAEILKKR